MEKSELENGSIVQDCAGDKYIKIDDYLYDLKDGRFLRFANYDRDLKFKERLSSHFDIVKVCQHSSVSDNLRAHCIVEERIFPLSEWTWIREDDSKEMTVAEIEKALGISGLKIKKED